jgi:hypothetical protein
VYEVVVSGSELPCEDSWIELVVRDISDGKLSEIKNDMEFIVF